jgi:hypothetical protein
MLKIAVTLNQIKNPSFMEADERIQFRWEILEENRPGVIGNSTTEALLQFILNTLIGLGTVLSMLYLTGYITTHIPGLLFYARDFDAGEMDKAASILGFVTLFITILLLLLKLFSKMIRDRNRYIIDLHELLNETGEEEDPD